MMKEIKRIVQINRGNLFIKLEGGCSFHLPYSSIGENDNPTIVISPGASGSGAIPFQNTFEHLEQDYRLLVLDVPPLPTDKVKPSAELGVKILEEFAKRLEGQFSLLGYSAGGISAVKFCLRHPEKVNKLVLVASAGLGKDICRDMRLLSLPIIGEMLARLRIKPTEKSVQKSLKKLFHNPDKIRVDLALDILAQRTDWGFKDWRSWYLQFLRAGVNFWGQKIVLKDELQALSEKIPILIVWGKHDRVLSYRQMIMAKVACNKIKIKEMEDCGHWPQMEQPEEFCRIVADFL